MNDQPTPFQMLDKPDHGVAGPGLSEPVDVHGVAGEDREHGVREPALVGEDVGEDVADDDPRGDDGDEDQARSRPLPGSRSVSSAAAIRPSTICTGTVMTVNSSVLIAAVRISGSWKTRE